jgi:tetratricopeptide (TPR) repeat protein
VTDELTALWDFDDPAGSEQRFRERAASVGSVAPAERALTQVARALGLQERYDEAHAVLDGLSLADDESRVRTWLERGRLLRSAGDPARSQEHFQQAADLAGLLGLEVLHVDALHMLALVAPPEDALAAHYAALAAARTATDRTARDWDASVLNNIGMLYADAGDHGAALAAFEDALEARERIGDRARTRVARWMVAWSLRHLGMTEVALQLQQALRDELDALGLHDPYVDEEIELLTR